MMGAPLEISTAFLREAVDVLLSHVDAVEGDSVMIDLDMFWSVPLDQRYDVHAEPRELTIGQLSESL